MANGSSDSAIRFAIYHMKAALGWVTTSLSRLQDFIKENK